MSRRVVEPNKSTEPQYGAGYKLIGKNYTTADLHAKVTGRAKYAEDYRAEGMLFCKLLLSPLPHARVKRIDASQALAMPGVKAILTADDLPAPADTLTDNGTLIKASRQAPRPQSRSSSGPRPTSPKPRTAGCQWVRLGTIGPTTTSTLASKMPHSCWTKRSSRPTSAIKPLRPAARWLTGRTARSTFTPALKVPPRLSPFSPDG